MRTSNHLIATEIGTIASDWRTACLEEVCEPPQYGFTASATEQGNVRFLRITDITQSGVNWSDVPFCKCPPELYDKFRLATGDVVFARIGATTGKSYLVKDPPNSVFASYLIRVRPKKEMDPMFLAHFFRSSGYWRQVDAQKHTNLKKGISGSLLKTLIVPVPPLMEQRKIADVLGLLLYAIEQQARLIGLTTELKKALIQKLFTEGHHGEPQKETAIGLIPQSWMISRLGEHVKFKNGINFSSAQKGNIGIPTIDVLNMYGEEGCVVSLDKIYRVNKSIDPDHYLKDGDLLFVRSSLKLEGVGWSSMFKNGNEPTTFCGFIIRARLNDKNVLSPKFLTIYFRTEQARRQLISGGARVAITNINQGLLQQTQIPIPPEDEQREIADTIEHLDGKIAFHRRKQDLLSELFKTLLHQLLTGKIRVNDLDLSIPL